MNTFIGHRYALHRSDLVSNLSANDPEMLQRLSQYQAAIISKGANAVSSSTISTKILDLAVVKQSFLLAYLDGFMLIALFFLCAIPFMFMLRTQKIDKVTAQKIAEESH
jgi:DHA2 family multidrug resistance protein